MRTIDFNLNCYKDEVKTADKPVLFVARVAFATNVTNWYQRLSPAFIKLTTKCFDDKNNTLYQYSQQLSISSFVDINQLQPTIDIKYTEHFTPPTGADLRRQSYYLTSIEIEGIQFQSDEKLSLSVMERSYVQARVDNWKERIDRLYSDINSWLQTLNGFSCKAGHPVYMNEELMTNFEIPAQNIPTLDVVYNNKILSSFKPKGLWIMGANGRIDMLTSKGSYMIVDTANTFEEPSWVIYSPDKKTKTKLDKEIFSQTLSFLAQ